MVQAPGTVKKTFCAATIFAAFAFTAIAQEDPSSRVARLSFLQGNVSMDPGGLEDWAPATLNRPFSVGDYLYTDQGARAELHTDIAVLRLGQQTNFGFLNLNDQSVQISLNGGDMYFRLHNFTPDQTFEVDTPNAAVTLLRDGIYRFRVDPDGNMTFVVVRQGGAVITGGGQTFNLDAGNSAMLSGTDQLSFDVESAPSPDDFDNWCYTRDAREAHRISARYLPPTVIGYEDLDDYGGWQQVATYGAVWYPREVASGWAPYHYGHWAWVEPWGWTWVDDLPWGFAPFHYGRWIYVSGRWGWAPGPIAVASGGGPVVRPYYAPALVAWFGGAHFGVGVSVGSAPTVGWVSLGWGEVYTPSYHCSQRYFTNVNVSNTRVVNTVNITNVYKTVYVNKIVYNQTFVNTSAPGAVVAMKQTEFAGGRSARVAAVTVPAANVAQLRQAAVTAPPVAPTRQSVAPGLGQSAPRPPAQLMQRQVVAKATPPPAPPTFAARQQYLQQHVGEPVNSAVMRQAVAPQAKPVVTVHQVKAATAAPVQVHPGQRVGNQAVFANRAVPGAVAARPGAPAQAQTNAPQSAKQPVPAPAVTPRAVNAVTPPPAKAVTTAPALKAAPGTEPAAPGAKTAPVVPAAKTAPAAPVVKTAPATPVVKTEPVAPAAKTVPIAPATKPAPDTPVVKTAPAAPVVRTAPASPVVKTEPATPPPAPAKPVTPAVTPEVRRPATSTAEHPAAAPPNPQVAPTHPVVPPTATHTAPPPSQVQHPAPPKREEKKDTTKDTKEEKKDTKKGEKKTEPPN